MFTWSLCSALQLTILFLRGSLLLNSKTFLINPPICFLYSQHSPPEISPTLRTSAAGFQPCRALVSSCAYLRACPSSTDFASWAAVGGDWMSGRRKRPDSCQALLPLTFLPVSPLLIPPSHRLSPRTIPLFRLGSTFTCYVLDPEFSPKV